MSVIFAGFTGVCRVAGAYDAAHLRLNAAASCRVIADSGTRSIQD